MPLVALTLAAYVAGLLTGFSQSLPLAVAAVGVSAIVGARRSQSVAVGLSVLALVGVVLARSSLRADERCLNEVLHLSALTLVVDDSAGPGAYVRAHFTDCSAAASVSVAQGQAAAGSTVIARGAVVRSQHGLMIQHAAITLVSGPALLTRWRTNAGRSIDATFGGDAPLVRALVIADRHELSPELRDSFAAAGLAHILAIAGLHIGIVAAAIALLLEVVGVARPRAAVLTIGAIVLYVLAIGAPVPAVRSATMLTTLLMSRLVQRSTSRWAIVAIGASQPVIAPSVVLEVGYQLSVVGVVAMIVAGMLGRRIGVHRQRAIVKAVLITVIGTTVATVATAPIVAWVFGRVSIVAPLTNLAAAPLIALAQPIVFFGMLSSPFHPLASLLADAAHPLLAALTWVATTGAALPHGSVTVAPTLAAAVIASVLSAAVIAACASPDWMRPALVASASALVLVWIPILPSRSGLVEVHMIDVGQGDAIALRTPHSHWILFDAGRAWAAGDAGRSTILPYLGRIGGPLDVFVLSHPHTDHVGGAASVLRALHPSIYVDGGFPGPAEAYRQSLDAARTSNVRWVRAHPGDTLAIDGVSIKFLAPDSSWTAGLRDPNLASVVALVRIGDVRILLMGDAERAEEDWLLQHAARELGADVLKVGHHGSVTSSSEPFLDAVQPRLALVSVGAGNSYHLPTPHIMQSLAAHGAQVLRTDRLGTIVVRTDGHRIFVETAGDSWELPLVSRDSSSR